MNILVSTFTHSKEEVQRRLEALPSRSRIAFGLSCCERMLPNYVKFKQEAKGESSSRCELRLMSCGDTYKGKP